MEDQLMVFDVQVFGSDVDPDDSFSYTASNILPLPFNDVLDSRRLSYDSELNGSEPTVKAVQHDILSMASLEITTDELRPFLKCNTSTKAQYPRL